MGHLAGTLVALKIHINHKLNILEEMAAEIRTRGEIFSPKLVVDVLSAFYKLKFYPGEATLKSILDFAFLKLNRITGGEATKLAYLFAQFDVIEGSLSFFEDIRKRVLEGSLTVSAQEASSLAWAFTITDRLDNSLFLWVINIVESLPETSRTDRCKVLT